MPCPCGSTSPYETCCEPFHKGKSFPATAEQLMRSRYSAFVKQEIAYLRETLWPPNQKHFDEIAHRSRAENSLWLGLSIYDIGGGSEQDSRGTVLFNARSMANGRLQEQVENSLFRKRDGRWYYVKAVG